MRWLDILDINSAKESIDFLSSETNKEGAFFLLQMDLERLNENKNKIALKDIGEINKYIESASAILIQKFGPLSEEINSEKAKLDNNLLNNKYTPPTKPLPQVPITQTTYVVPPHPNMPAPPAPNNKAAYVVPPHPNIPAPPAPNIVAATTLPKVERPVKPEKNLIDDLKKMGYPKNEKLNGALYTALAPYHKIINKFAKLNDPELANGLKKVSRATTIANLDIALDHLLSKLGQLKLNETGTFEANKIPEALKDALLEENKRRPVHFKPATGLFDTQVQKKEFAGFRQDAYSFTQFAAFAKEKSEAYRYENKFDPELENIKSMATNLQPSLQKYRYYLELKLNNAHADIDKLHPGYAAIKRTKNIAEIVEKIHEIDKALENLKIASTNFSATSSLNGKNIPSFNKREDAENYVNEYLNAAPTESRNLFTSGEVPVSQPDPSKFIYDRQEIQSRPNSFNVNPTQITVPNGNGTETVRVAVVEETNPQKTYSKQTFKGDMNALLNGSEKELMKFSEECVQRALDAVKGGPINIGLNCPINIATKIMAICEKIKCPCNAPVSIQKAFKAADIKAYEKYLKEQTPHNIGHKEIKAIAEKANIDLPAPSRRIK